MPSLPSQALDSADGSFRILDILVVKVDHWRPPGRVTYEKHPTTNMFDDDEWIRSLAETQAVTADTPDERITEVDTKKSSSYPDGVRAKICLEATLGTQ